VNKETGGGNKSGSGRGVKDTNVSSKRGGRIGGPRAIALREKGRRDAQTQCRGKIRSAQDDHAEDRAEKIACRNLPTRVGSCSIDAVSEPRTTR
jgi:hypothetical protein